MRNLDELNMNEGGEPVTRHPPTTTHIAAFQTMFGVVLPKEYLDFLRYSNGGHPELNSFRPVGLSEDVLCGISRFYFLNDGQEDLEGVWAATKAWRAALGRDIVSIGDDGGGDQILLSFDQTTPRVEFCIHDEGMRIARVADSFAEFVDMLTEDPDMI